MGTMRGRFISLEGGEGAGKSTQARLLAEFLRGRGIVVRLTREPGGVEGAEEIRRLLTMGAPDRWRPMTETLLHLAARVEHWERLIAPSLAIGEWVISDRFSDSAVAYQGYGQGVGAAAVARLHSEAIGGHHPDMTLILDLPVDVGLARAAERRGREARYEQMSLDFHHRVREGFLAIARHAPERCRVIRAEEPVMAVAAAIQACIMAAEWF
ncbi:Thymidylate kinase [Azospirillaceae bacterium]